MDTVKKVDYTDYDTHNHHWDVDAIIEKARQEGRREVVEWAEVSFKAGQEERAKALYENVICPMCYRLNPHHATADNGVGCKSCRDKEVYCGELN